MQSPQLKILPTATLRRGTIAAFAVQVAGVGAAFGLQIVLAHALGPSQLGVYALVLSWLSILALACPLGFDALLLQRAAVYRAREQWDLFRAILKRSLLITAVCGVGFGLLFYLIGSKLSSELSTKYAFAAGGVLLPFWALNAVRQSALRVCKAIVSARAPDVLIRPVALICFLLPWVVARAETEAWRALLLHAIAAVVAFMVGTGLLMRLTPRVSASGVAKEVRREWLRAAMPLMAVSLLGVAANEVDKIVLGSFRPAAELGLYAVASRLAYFLLFSQDAIAIVAAPLIAEVHGTHPREELENFLMQITRLTIIGTIPILLLLLFFGPSILRLFGSEFTSAEPLLLVLVAGQFFNVIFGPVGFALNMTGNQKSSMRAIGFALLIQIPLIIAGAIYGGALGCASAAAASIALRQFLLWRAVRRNLGVNPTALRSFARLFS